MRRQNGRTAIRREYNEVHIIDRLILQPPIDMLCALASFAGGWMLDTSMRMRLCPTGHVDRLIVGMALI